MRFFALLLVGLLVGCASGPAARVVSHPEITFTEINPNKWTALTRQNVEHLVQVYHLSPLFFTNKIQIQTGVIPHSHPVLTLNTRYAEYPHKILSQLLHEQMHWWLTQNDEKMKKATRDLKIVFPRLPKEANYSHLVVCFLEYSALTHFLERKEITKIWNDYINRSKIYPWMRSQARNNYKALEKITLKHGLIPEMLKPVQKPTKKPPLSPAKRLKKR